MLNKLITLSIILFTGLTWADESMSVWQKAKLNGVDYRAIGNEPSWLIEISSDNALIKLNYGTDIINAKVININESKEKAQTELTLIDNDKTFTFLIERNECKDTMSGQTFSTRATLTYLKGIYIGCGKALH